MADRILSWFLAFLLLLAAVLQILLEKKRCQPLSLGWSIQAFVFPVIWIGALVIWQLGWGDYLFPAVLLGFLEELICWGIKRKKKD